MVRTGLGLPVGVLPGVEETPAGVENGVEDTESGMLIVRLAETEAGVEDTGGCAMGQLCLLQ